MSDYNNGEIYGWNGGKCPVHPESEVRVWLRKNYSDLEDRLAGQCRWNHFKDSGDIIAFQVIKPYVEPKVIWVNEYKAGLISYYSESEAKRAKSPNPVRIAVKYVEAKDE